MSPDDPDPGEEPAGDATPGDDRAPADDGSNDAPGADDGDTSPDVDDDHDTPTDDHDTPTDDHDAPTDDAPSPEGASAAGADAGEPSVGEDAAGGDGTPWPVRYLKEQSVHVVVVALLAAYPGIHHVATASPLGAEAAALLPQVETMVAVLYFGLFAMSFDFISGYTGYLSFGHAAFYGTGAYTVILVANGKLALTVPGTAVTLFAPGTPFMVSLLLAGVLAALLAVVIGSVSFRLTGVYFAMITLGFAQVLYVLVRDWDWLAANPRDGPAVSFDTHPEGFQVGVPWVDKLNLAIGRLTGEEVTLLDHQLGTAAVSFYMIGLVVLVCYFAMQRIIHSPFGRVMIAIRENEERAEAVGYETFRYKLGAFAISGFFAGIAGGLFAGFKRSATPDNAFFFLVSGDALLASIIGGFGTLVGPLFGRLFDETVREFLTKSGGGLLPYLRDHVPASVLETVVYNGLTVGGAIETFLNGHAPLYLGLLFVVFVLYVPNGLLGTVRDRLGGTVAKQLPDRVERRLRTYLQQ